MNEPAPPCILVVEDEQPIRDGLGDALRFRGWRADLAADGEAGLRAGLAGGDDQLPAGFGSRERRFGSARVAGLTPVASGIRTFQEGKR